MKILINKKLKTMTIEELSEELISMKTGGKLIPKYKSGIHIKKANRGKFTATKKATGKSTEELTHSTNPLTKKRAVFAQNSKKWSKK